MKVFIDTSAFFAYYDADDAHHSVTKELWHGLLAQDAELLTSSYVLLETSSLLQRRLGLPWAGRLHTEAKPLLGVVWVDEDLHDVAVSATLAADQRDLSLVDCVSFEVMRRLGIGLALSFDRHFAERGYVLPSLG